MDNLLRKLNFIRTYDVYPTFVVLVPSSAGGPVRFDSYDDAENFAGKQKPEYGRLDVMVIVRRAK